MQTIDCRGKACPQPVIMAKQALEQLDQGELVLIVDNPSSCENVERFARSQGCSVRVERAGSDYCLHLEKGRGDGESRRGGWGEQPEKIVVYINSNVMGVGEEALGSILMGSFLKTLLDVQPLPHRLILVNSGIRLAVEGSAVLGTLRSLSERGVGILACGTCLDYYGLKEKLSVGVVSNMYDIAQSLLEADRLVKP